MGPTCRFRNGFQLHFILFGLFFCFFVLFFLLVLLSHGKIDRRFGALQKDGTGYDARLLETSLHCPILCFKSDYRFGIVLAIAFTSLARNSFITLCLVDSSELPLKRLFHCVDK